MKSRKDELEELVDKINESNRLYREGTPILSDSEYDSLILELETMDPDNPVLNSIGFDIQNRKEPLPIEMASMNKEKTLGELWDWFRLRGISSDEWLIITPKYDGLSLCLDEMKVNAWTRGDGKMGQRSDPHYELIGNKTNGYPQFRFTYGEVIMKKSVFMDKYSENFANPRNLVSGLLNSKEINPALSDCEYIRYGATNTGLKSKSEILDNLNNQQNSKVPYIKTKLGLLSEELLMSIFNEYSCDYEIDGLIIELNSLELQSQLGRETNNNPVWARAYKSKNFENSGVSEVTGITWNISKEGKLKPTIHIKPLKLDGVTISNVTGNNARYIKEMGIGIGSMVKVVRSGMVIPKIVEVIQRVNFEIPNVGYPVKWDESGVELITIGETDDQKLKRLISFFSVLETDNFSEGVITQLWDCGIRDLNKILNMSISDFQKLDGFGARKSKIVYESIQSAINGVELSKLQHASGIFVGMGSKKLKNLEHFKTKPTPEEVMRIEGFAEKSARVYIENWDRFWQFIEGLPIKISEYSNTPQSSDLEGKVFTFTGVRRPDLVDIIKSRGGKEGSSVSKNTTYLICVDKNSTSGKMSKARELGVEILNVSDLENLLNVVK